MTTERTDHVGEAMALLGAADSDVSRNHPLNTTLALVEQQRITNRLKVAEIDLAFEVAEYKLGRADFRIHPYLTPEDWASIESEG